MIMPWRPAAAVSELHKVFAALVTPLFLVVFVLLYAAFARKRTYRPLCLTAAILLLVFGSGFGSRLLLRSLEGRYAGNAASCAPVAPAIVVLGGGLVNSNSPSGAIELGPSSERLWMAVELYRAGKSPLILITGGKATGDAAAESTLASRILKDWGVAPSAILTEDEAKDTRQNAVFSQRILAQRGIDRILLVTSAVHMPRAYATFRETGLSVFPVPADYLTGNGDRVTLPALLPSANALVGSGTAIKEWLGIIFYRLRGWAI